MGNKDVNAHWWRDFLVKFNACQSDLSLSDLLRTEAGQAGFDFYAHGVRWPIPFTNVNVFIDGSYPVDWLRRYAEKNYGAEDPTFLPHVTPPGLLKIWDRKFRSKNQEFFKEAGEWGINFGASITLNCPDNSFRALIFARTNGSITVAEKIELDMKMRCIISLLSDKMYADNNPKSIKIKLTEKEREVLLWMADGKCSFEISDIMGITKNTVNFHIKNIIRKFNAPNRLLAVVYASASGLI